MKSLLLFAALLTTLMACKKETNPTTTSEVVVNLNLVSPTENQTYQFGDTVKILGSLSSATSLHGYNIRLNHPTINMFVINQAYHEHGTVFNLNERWVNNVTDTTELKLIIDVAIDHDGTLKTFEKYITCYPQ